MLLDCSQMSWICWPRTNGLVTHLQGVTINNQQPTQITTTQLIVGCRLLLLVAPTPDNQPPVPTESLEPLHPSLPTATSSAYSKTAAPPRAAAAAGKTWRNGRTAAGGAGTAFWGKSTGGGSQEPTHQPTICWSASGNIGGSSFVDLAGFGAEDIDKRCQEAAMISW